MLLIIPIILNTYAKSKKWPIPELQCAISDRKLKIEVVNFALLNKLKEK